MDKEVKEKLEGITFRSYKPEDYADVRRNLEEGNLFYEDMDSEERLKVKVERNPNSILVAERNGKVVGNVFLIEDGWVAFAFRLAVAKEYRKQGMGAKLMKAVEEEAKKRGYNELHILVGEDEKELQGYYSELGYEKGNLYRWMYQELHKK